MLFDLLIKNANVVFPNEVLKRDIAVNDGKIVGIFEGVPVEGANVIDGTGRYLLPGAIDTHSHFFEPGPNYREDVFHGTRAAAAGGYTTVMDMPNTDPPVKDEETFRLKQEIFRRNAFIDYMLWGSSLPGGTENIRMLKKIGCSAFKAFVSDAGETFPRSDSLALYEGMCAVKEVGGIFCVHAEDPEIVGGLRKRYDIKPWNLRMHDAARPWIAELSAISKVLFFARVTGCPLHICHTSIPEGVDLIWEARKQGVDVTVETCPHYLLFDTESVESTGTYSLICPPIRSRERVEKMWKLLAEGKIDYMGTDHAPYTAADKNPVNLWDAPGGAPNIDIAVPAILDEGVNKRGLPITKISSFISGNAAKRFGLYPAKGVIRVGSDADLILVDMCADWTFSRINSYSKTRETGFAFEGRRLSVKVDTTILRGTVIYNQGEILGSGNTGKMLSIT